jgi:hypothetical protein
MTIPALLSLAFSAWMAWTLYASVREERLSGFSDLVSTLWIASGSMAGIAVAVATLIKAYV